MKKIVNDGKKYGYNVKEGMSNNFFKIVTNELGNKRGMKAIKSKVKRSLLNENKAKPGYSEFSEIKALIASGQQKSVQTSYVVMIYNIIYA